MFIGRWIALIRIATAWPAGINHMRFRTFLSWNVLGAMSWGLTFGLIGYLGGGAAAATLGSVGLGAAVAIGVACLFAAIAVKVRSASLARGTVTDSVAQHVWPKTTRANRQASTNTRPSDGIAPAVLMRLDPRDTIIRFVGDGSDSTLRAGAEPP